MRVQSLEDVSVTLIASWLDEENRRLWNHIPMTPAMITDVTNSAMETDFIGTASQSGPANIR